jgi:hypothetical protein
VGCIDFENYAAASTCCAQNNIPPFAKSKTEIKVAENSYNRAIWEFVRAMTSCHMRPASRLHHFQWYDSHSTHEGLFWRYGKNKPTCTRVEPSNEAISYLAGYRYLLLYLVQVGARFYQLRLNFRSNRQQNDIDHYITYSLYFNLFPEKVEPTLWTKNTREWLLISTTPRHQIAHKLPIWDILTLCYKF